MALYSEYPQFRERLEDLEALYRQEREIIRTNGKQMTGYGMSLVVLSDLSERLDTCRQGHLARVEALHQEMGVPVLRAWEHSLEHAGEIVFHNEEPELGREVEATIRHRPDEETLILELTLRITVSNDAAGRNSLDHHLLQERVHYRSWEARKGEPQTTPSYY